MIILDTSMYLFFDMFFFPNILYSNYILFILAYSKNISIDSFRIHVHL